jgi:polar amino acid transport system substrate-binding protein
MTPSFPLRLRLNRNRHLIFTAIGLAIGVLVVTLILRGGVFTPTDSTWLAIQERGTWRVGMDPSFPPFEWLDDSGQPVGYDVELAQALAAELGVEVEIIAIGFDGLIDALQVGRIDSVISALPYDPRLTQDIRYTSSYFEAGTRLIVPIDSLITDVEDLANRRVAVEWGSAGDAEARQLQRQHPSIERLPYPTPDEALAALLNGKSDALIVDGVTLRLAQGNGAPITAVGPALESDPYVIAVAMPAFRLHEALEEALTRLRSKGVLEEIEQRWFFTEE